MPLFSKKITPTTITTNIEKATDPSQTEMDWSLVFQICDVINNTELGAKEGRKLLQKKMLSNEVQTQILSLELLDALSENCHAKFSSQLGAKSFAEDLESLASSKSTDDRVHGKLVHCLQNWTTRLGTTDPAYSGLVRVYERVMNGVQPTKRLAGFQLRPTAPGDQRLAESIYWPSQEQRRQRQQLPPAQQQRQSAPADPMNDVLLAKNNAQLFSQTLSFTDPTQEDITKNELIQEFYGKCKMFQKIIARHLETNNDPDVISSLLEANSELVTTFKAYDDMLERHAVNEATANSKTLNHRSTRPPEDLDLLNNNNGSSLSTSAEPSGAGSSSSKSPAANLQKLVSDPFDPFADDNEVVDSPANDAGQGHNLPPPLTPQRMHN